MTLNTKREDRSGSNSDPSLSVEEIPTSASTTKRNAFANLYHSPWFRKIAFAIAALVLLLLGLWLRWNFSPQWIQHVGPPETKKEAWLVGFIDPDDYTRLDRVKRILEGQGPILRVHPWENWPEGIHPSTTAPLDFCILALYLPCSFWFDQPLDWAGAFISPLLYISLFIFLAWWSKAYYTVVPRLFLLLGLSTLPGAVVATLFAHPDHQSLLLLLLTVALSVERSRWDELGAGAAMRKRWSITAGCAWGLALWVSFYEPVILFGMVVSFNLIVRKREQLWMLGTVALWLAFYFIVEGFHSFTPEVLSHQTDLYRWGLTIGELRSLNFLTYYYYLTPIALILPFLLYRLARIKNLGTTDRLILNLTSILLIITIYQQRWLIYGTMMMLLFLTEWLQRESSWAWKIGFAGLFIFGIMTSAEHAMTDTGTLDSQKIRRIAKAISAPGGVMAYWWSSPSLLYLSRQPIVASSSHGSISGIVDSARFFTSTNWLAADEILQRRKVRWIVVQEATAEVRAVLNTIAFGPDPAHWPPDSSEIILRELTKGTGAKPTRYQLRAYQEDILLYEYNAKK